MIRLQQKGMSSDLIFDAAFPIKDVIRTAIAALRETPPSGVRMNVAQQHMLDLEGMEITSVIVSREQIDDLELLFKAPPRTLAGMPIVYDLSLPEDVIVFEDATGKELSRITNLRAPEPFETT